MLNLLQSDVYWNLYVEHSELLLDVPILPGSNDKSYWSNVKRSKKISIGFDVPVLARTPIFIYLR